jgi:hypothetical protein
LPQRIRHMGIQIGSRRDVACLPLGLISGNQWIAPVEEIFKDSEAYSGLIRRTGQANSDATLPARSNTPRRSAAYINTEEVLLTVSSSMC